MTVKTVLITGTSSGIGLAAAVAAAQAGWRVVATMRDTSRSIALRAAAGGAPLDVRPLDVTDPASIARCMAGAYAPALEAYINRTRNAFAAAQSPAEAAAAIIKVLEADKPLFRVQTSAAARQFAGVKLADLDGSRVVGLTSSWMS